MPTFAERLRALMEVKGWSANDLARESGLSYLTIRSYLATGKNSRQPSLTNAKKLAAALSCSVDDLASATDI